MCDTTQLTRQQAPRQQVQAPQQSELEILLKNVENVSATIPVHQGDVALAEDAQAQNKADKRDIWRIIFHGLIGKRWTARLSKEERTRTRSDVRRTDVKARLVAIAQNFAGYTEVKNDTKFLEILTNIKKYGRQDVTAVSKSKEEKGERVLFQKICDGLEEYVGKATFQGNELICRMAANLKMFFDSQRNGNLKVPASTSGSGSRPVVILDNLRPPVYTRKVPRTVTDSMGNVKTVMVNVEDPGKGKMTEKKMTDQPLFSHEPSVNDIRQGTMGDCYLLSVLSCIVNNNPQTIRDCMRDNGDGTIYVRFYSSYRFNGVKQYRPVYVNVRKVIPRYNKKTNPFAKGAFWVQMMERAYAIARNRVIGKDQFGNRIDLQGKSNDKKNKFTNAKQTWESKPTAEEKKEYLDELKKDPGNLFMFDDNGNFYQSYEQIPQESSYADLPTGTVEEAYESILGKKSESFDQGPLARTTTSWVTSYAVHNLQQMHHKLRESSQGAANGQNVQNAPSAQKVRNAPRENVEIMAEVLLALLKSDPQTAGRNWKLEDITRLRGDLENRQVRVMGNCAMIMTNALHNPAYNTIEGKRNGIISELESEFSGIIDQPVNDNTDARILILQKLCLVLRRMTEGLTTAKETLMTGAYTVEEEAQYMKLKKLVDQGKMIATSAKKINAPTRGLYGESVKDGIAGPHGYTILGVEEREINLGHGQIGLCKFVKLRNPWGRGVVRYNVEGEELHAEEHTSSKQGVFLIEYRHFLARFGSVTYV